MNRTLSLSVLAAGALASVAVAGCGGSSEAASPPAASSGPVDVKLSEYAITPSATTVKAGKITFKATNAGKIGHEMVVLRTSKPAAQLGSGSRISESGSVGEIGELKAGKTGSVTLDLKPGHYALICNIAGHYMSGMRADLTVT